MVKKVWQLLSREWHGLHEAAYLLGFFAFLSQLLALLRDRLLAHTFGASHLLDLYYAAFRIPDFIFVSLGSIVSLSVLIPFLLEKIERSEGEAKHFLTQLFSFFFLLIAAVSAVAYWLTPTILPRLFPDYVGDANYLDLVAMSRVLLLSPLFLGLSNFLASVTQIYKRFFIYALSPLLYNLGIIAGVLWLYPTWGLTGLVWGVALGAALHCLIQVPFVLKQGLLPRFTSNIHWSSIRKVVLLSLPRTITLSANEISELFLISLASLLTAGSISVFSFGFNLQGVPLSIIGVSYSLAAFPVLTKLFTSGETEKFIKQMINSAQHIIFWTLPATVLFIVLRAQVVRVILGTGRFDWSDTRLTAATLALFVLSLVPQSLSLLFVRSYYARGRTWTPLLLNVISSAVIIGGSWGLVWVFRSSQFFRYFIGDLLKVDNLKGAEVLMLPLGFSLGLLLNLLLHWRFFHRDYPSFSQPVLRTFWCSFSASVIAGAFAYLALNFFSNIFDLEIFWGIFAQGLLAGLVGVGTGIGLLYLLGSAELQTIWQTLHRKIWKTQIVGPDPDLN
jgi:putative peptidoglycan lipid II flippase